MRGIYIFLGNLIMGIAVMVALISGGSTFITAILEGASPNINISDFIFPMVLFITGFTIQFCSLAKRYFVPIVCELLLCASLVFYIRESLNGGFSWWFVSLREYVSSTLLFTGIGFVLPALLIILMATLIVRMVNISIERAEKREKKGRA